MSIEREVKCSELGYLENKVYRYDAPEILKKEWNNNILAFKNLTPGTRCCLIEAEWLNSLMSQFGITRYESEGFNNKNRLQTPDAIDNKKLLQNDTEIFQEQFDEENKKEPTYSQNYTQRLLMKDMRIKQNYYIISESFFKFISNYYKCPDPIFRYSVKGSYNSSQIEVYLRTVLVLNFPLEDN